MSRRTKIDDSVIAEIESSVDTTITIGGWEKDTPYPLPVDLKPYAIDSDKYFSPVVQIAFAQKRKAAENTVQHPTMILTGFDLLILREKRKEAADPGDMDWEGGCPPFSVGTYTAGIDSPKYELVLATALSFVESMLYLEDAEGKPLSKWAIAQRLRSIGAPLPEGYEYLGTDAPCPSYWDDADKYTHLIKLRHRENADE